jgi:hypothetical protein
MPLLELKDVRIMAIGRFDDVAGQRASPARILPQRNEAARGGSLAAVLRL